MKNLTNSNAIKRELEYFECAYAYVCCSSVHTQDIIWQQHEIGVLVYVCSIYSSDKS